MLSIKEAKNAQSVQHFAPSNSAMGSKSSPPFPWLLYRLSSAIDWGMLGFPSNSRR
jgi:hypothetical protein